MPIDELIDEVLVATGDDYVKALVVMTKCLDMIRKQCPEVGVRGIQVATGYWIDGNRHAEELEEARVACWNYLDSGSNSVSIVEKKVCSVRAVICVLYPELQQHDVGELLEWFFLMMDRASSGGLEISNKTLERVLG